MNTTHKRRAIPVALGPGLALGLILGLTLTLAAGCGAGEPEDPGGTAGTTDALSTGYEDALDVTAQLALGTLKLEGTANAVTGEQAAQLLPLWQALSNSGIQAETERQAIARQIESTMTKAQVAAIGAMALTQADEQAWIQEQGPAALGRGAPDGGTAPEDAAPAEAPAGGDAPGGGVFPEMSDEDRAAMREKFESMTEEELAQMREQFGQRGGASGTFRPGGVGGTTSSGVVLAVVRLLSERSGQASALPAPQRPTPPDHADDDAGVGASLVDALRPSPAAPTATPQPTTGDILADDGVIADDGADGGASLVDALLPSSTPSSGATLIPVNTTPAPPGATQEPAADTGSVVSPALVQVEDKDPGPPFSVGISLNQATPNPLLDGTQIYRISGLLRNEGDAVYAVNAVHVTFFDAGGFRGSFNPFPKRRYGEYVWHGALEADFDCMLLAPGEACPFTAEIAAYAMGSFLVHADAVIAEWREPAPVEVRSSELTDQGSSVQINGTILNPNTYAIKNVVVSASLLDANGQITSIGSAYLVQSIAPGASVSFVAMVPAEPYVTYQVHAQAEGDFG